MFSLQFFYPSFFSYTEERDVEAETDMKPQCSCVVYSGILLTWDPLGGFGGGGGGGGGRVRGGECTTGLGEKKREAWA